MVKMANYQQKFSQGYDRGVKVRQLALGDLVLRKVVGTVKNPLWGKLGPNQEGYYRITSVASIGAYYLEDLDENVVPHPWNVNNLHKWNVKNFGFRSNSFRLMVDARFSKVNHCD